MTVIALLQTEPWIFNFDEQSTKLKVIRVFGSEHVVHVEKRYSGSHIPTTLASGFSMILDCSIEELCAHHPDAWVSNNPLAGRWEAVAFKVNLDEIVFESLDEATVASFNRMICRINEKMEDDVRELHMVKIDKKFERNRDLLKAYELNSYPRFDPKNHLLEWWMEKNETPITK